jgi:NAD+ kinase
LVVHPSRAVDLPLQALREWAGERHVGLVQIPASCRQHQVAEPGDASSCDLIVSIGGDGTTLAAIRAAAEADCPALGVACGSLGALTTVSAAHVTSALERYSRGDWIPRSLPALWVGRDVGDDLYALNDFALVRAGQGQLFVTARVDGVIFARLAGDGCVVSTPIGSSAYSLSAGGPLIAVETSAFLFTPLPTHGGACPPLVVAAGSHLEVTTTAGHDAARLEVDGQIVGPPIGVLTISLRPAVATIVSFDDQEPFLAGLRRRRIIIDSPRILAEDDSR